MTIEERRYERLLEERRYLSFTWKDYISEEEIIPNYILFEISKKNLTSRYELKKLLGETIFMKHGSWIIKTLLTSEEYIVIDHYLDSYPDLIAT